MRWQSLENPPTIWWWPTRSNGTGREWRCRWLRAARRQLAAGRLCRRFLHVAQRLFKFILIKVKQEQLKKDGRSCCFYRWRQLPLGLRPQMKTDMTDRSLWPARLRPMVGTVAVERSKSIRTTSPFKSAHLFWIFPVGSLVKERYKIRKENKTKFYEQKLTKIIKYGNK